MNKKRGQVTIFVVISLLVIGAGILIYLFFPQIRSAFTQVPENPQAFLDVCLNDRVLEGIELVSLQGGFIEPRSSYFYQGDDISYLCYTNEYYQPCIIQVALLKNRIESEIKSYIEEDVINCLRDMEDSYERRGYSVSLDYNGFNLELFPKRISTRIDSEFILRKDGVERYDGFDISMNNNLYELVSVATSILQWEVEYGDAETSIYMTYYPDLRVEKKKQDDGTTIYIITERSTGNKFQFASRSYAWPPGYGAWEMID